MKSGAAATRSQAAVVKHQPQYGNGIPRCAAPFVPQLSSIMTPQVLELLNALQGAGHQGSADRQNPHGAAGTIRGLQVFPQGEGRNSLASHSFAEGMALPMAVDHVHGAHSPAQSPRSTMPRCMSVDIMPIADAAATSPPQGEVVDVAMRSPHHLQHGAPIVPAIADVAASGQVADMMAPMQAQFDSDAIVAKERKKQKDLKDDKGKKRNRTGRTQPLKKVQKQDAEAEDDECNSDSDADSDASLAKVCKKKSNLKETKPKKRNKTATTLQKNARQNEPEPEEGETTSGGEDESDEVPAVSPRRRAANSRQAKAAARARTKPECGKKAIRPPYPKDARVLQYKGSKFTDPLRYGYSTIFNSLQKSSWRLKLFPSDKHEIYFSYNAKKLSPKASWEKLVKKVKMVNK